MRETANSVVAFVAELTGAARAVDPDAAESVHRGSTSQDVLDTALMLLYASVLDRVNADLRSCAESLACLADPHRNTPTAGRTLTQRAVPVTFGLRAGTWLHLVFDAVDRVRRVRAGLPVSIGGAAGMLAAYQEYARQAGDSASTTVAATRSRRPAAGAGRADPSLTRDSCPEADVATVLTITTGALGKLAADVLVLTRMEIGEVSEEQAPGRGASSAMPQKHNPVFATLIASAARQLPPIA